VHIATKDFRTRRIRLADFPLEVRRDDPLAHALKDVFCDRLETRHLATLIAQLLPGLAQPFGEVARKIGHQEESKKAHKNPYLERPRFNLDLRSGGQEAEGRILSNQVWIQRRQVSQFQ